jgi:transcriptional regulator with XRE-family HTH domain
MDITSLRKDLGLSLEAFAATIGLKSRGQVSDLEAGRRTPSVPVALAIERVSSGRIDAATLNADVALVRSAANDPLPHSEAA